MIRKIKKKNKKTELKESRIVCEESHKDLEYKQFIEDQ